MWISLMRHRNLSSSRKICLSSRLVTGSFLAWRCVSAWTLHSLSVWIMIVLAGQCLPQSCRAVRMALSSFGPVDSSWCSGHQAVLKYSRRSPYQPPMPHPEASVNNPKSVAGIVSSGVMESEAFHMLMNLSHVSRSSLTAGGIWWNLNGAESLAKAWRR